MRQRLTITLDSDIYDGLQRVVGRRKISDFIAQLVRPHVMPQPLDAAAHSHDPARLVRSYPRPKVWHCIYCGQQSPGYNDYYCLACHQARPFMGGSATMIECRRCHEWNLAIAQYCEWCGMRP